MDAAGAMSGRSSLGHSQNRPTQPVAGTARKGPPAWSEAPPPICRPAAAANAWKNAIGDPQAAHGGIWASGGRGCAVAGRLHYIIPVHAYRRMRTAPPERPCRPRPARAPLADSSSGQGAMRPRASWG